MVGKMKRVERVCVITGAGSGIGKATAIEMSKNDVYKSIVLIGRNLQSLEETKQQMDTENHRVITLGCDLADLEKIPQAVRTIYDQCGRIDCLLNIAGYTEPRALLDTTLESFEYTYKVNVFSVFLLIKECVKYMKKNGGKILNVASTAGITPRPGWLSYSSSKAAIVSMSETLSQELAEYRILVYCISPGRCATKLRKKLAPDEDPDTIMQPHEVAEVIVSLVDTKEKCLDGQNIIIRKQVGFN